MRKWQDSQAAGLAVRCVEVSPKDSYWPPSAVLWILDNGFTIL